VLAVERLGQDPGRGRFSYAAHARKEIRLGDAIALNRVLEGLDNRLLADHLLERLRSVLTGEN